MIQLLSENFQDKWRYKDVQNPVASTWWISFQQIQQSNPLAADYLSFMSCIDPQDIPQFILPPPASEIEKIRAIGLLKSYEFVTDSETTKDKLLNLHRLVYIATRNFMRKSHTLENQMRRTLAQLESTILSREPEISFTQKAISLRGVYNHIITLLREECLRREQIKYPEFPGLVVYCLAWNFRLTEAEHLCTQFVEFSSTQKGFEHVTVYMLQSLKMILSLFKQQQMNQVLKPFMKRIVTISIQFRATVKSWISSSTECEGDERAEKSRSTIEGTPKSEIIAILNSQRIIAILFKDIGELTVSEALFQSTISESQIILGSHHPDTLYCQKRLAKQYHELRQNTKAEKIYLELINTTKSATCPDQTEILGYLQGLGAVYRYESRYAEAEQCYLQAISLSEEIHGPNDLGTLDFQFLLAVVYQNQSRYQEAEDVMLRVIQIKQFALGAERPLIVSADMTSLVVLYHEWGAFDKVEQASTQFEDYFSSVEEYSSSFDTEIICELRELRENVARIRAHAKRSPTN